MTAYMYRYFAWAQRAGFRLAREGTLVRNRALTVGAAACLTLLWQRGLEARTVRLRSAFGKLLQGLPARDRGSVSSSSAGRNHRARGGGGLIYLSF